jgi:hypothetical protein
MSVTVTGVDPSAYNANDKTILDVTSNTFSISSNVTSSYVSGGTARAQSSTNPDLGFAAGYNDGTYHHTGLFRDATDGIWKFFKNYTPEPDDSQYIDTSHASFQLAPLSVSDVTAANTITSPSFIGDLSGTAASATNISDGGANQIPFQTGLSSTAFNSNLTFDQTNSTLSTQNIIISGNTSLGAVENISITGGTDGYVLTTDGSGNLSWLQATQNTVIYIVQSLSLANGVYVSGSLSDIQTFADSNYYTLTDGTGTGPAWVFTTGFTDVVSFNRVVLNINYTASSGHTIYVQLYNNVSAVWDTIGTYTGLGSFYAFALQVISDTNYISSGAVQLRLWHSNAGNALHTTNIDYVALEMSTQGPQGPKGTTGTTGSTGATGAGVASGGTSGQILIKNSATDYDTSWVNNLAYDAANTANLNAANASYLTTGVVSNSLLSSIPNSSLANSTISGIQLGSNLNALSNGVGLIWSSGTNFNGSSAATLAIDSSIVTLTGSQTLTNKRLTLPVVDFTGIKIDGSTSGNTTIQATPIADSSILTLSANTGTLISTGDTGTVTSAMILNGTIVDADINSSAAILTSKLSANTISGVYLGGNLFSLVTGNGLSGGSYNGSGSITISANTGSTTVTGILQLNDTVISTSTSLAATANSVKTAYDQAINANTFNQAYTNSVVSSNNSSITTGYKSYTDSVVSSNNISLKAYTDSVVSSNNSSITTGYKSYTDSVVSSNNISLKSYTDSVVSSNNITLKSYTDSVVSSNNTTLKAYTDSVVGSNNVTLKAYTDSVVSSNNTSLTTAYKSYTDSVVSSNNVTLKAYTDSVVSSNNTSLRANDGITLASAKSYTDSANTFLQANDGITLASAKSYTDAKNTFNTLVTVSNDLIVSGNLTIQGTTTTLNSTTIRINDKNIELANVSSPTNTTADGGGITVIGATNKTFNWVNSTGAWVSSENLDLASGKSFSIGGVTVLTGSTLSSNVTGSSLTSVGTITSGVWNAGSVTASQLTSTVATGTAPFIVTSNTVVTNLNADLLDGLSSSDLKAYTDSVVSSNNTSLTTAYKSYTDSVVSSNNTTLKAYTDSVVSSNNSSLRANDGITLASAKAYTDSVVSSNNTSLTTAYKSYTDSVVSSNNVTLKAYTDSVVSSNNTSITTAYKSYTDSVVSSNNVTLKAYTDSVMSSNNTSLRANDGITLASAKSYADSNDGITLASAKSYTDAKNTFSTLVNISNDLIVTGNLTIQGTTTTLNSTTLRINDKNIELANVATPTNTTADGGGITVIGATNKTFNWVNSTGAWTSSENLDLASGKSFSINGVTVLTGSTLSSNVTTSSLTAVGTVTSGVWSSSFGAVSGANLTNLTAGNLVGVINNIPIGSGTANTGAFTTLSASGQITSTLANNTATGGGQIYLNGTTGNRIDFSAVGVAVPAFTTRSVGTKIVLYPAISGSLVDYAIGIESATLWSSVATSASSFKWYAGTANVATLSGTGNFSTSTLTSTVATGTAPFTVTSTTNVANLNASSLSGATFAAPGAIGSGTASTGAFTDLSYTGTLTGNTGVIAIGTNQIYKDASGNVGIGTSSPSYTLDIRNAANTTLHLMGTTSNVRGGLSVDVPVANTFYVGSYSSYPVVFGTNNAERMRIDSSGNVGIGLTPSCKLDINGLFLIRYGTGTYAGQSIRNTYGSASLQSVSYIDFQNENAIATGHIFNVHEIDGSSRIIFGATPAGSRSSDRRSEMMRINGNGNVLIGATTDGGYKLQVNGSFAATTKSFLIDHPTKEGMKLRYGSLESPYHGVRLTGEGVLINGTATVKLPDYIHGLCKQEGSQVQITNIKHGKVIWVEEISVDKDEFIVAADINDDKEYKFYWSFTAIRKDIEEMIVEFAE